jgi:hypothetical protein
VAGEVFVPAERRATLVRVFPNNVELRSFRWYAAVAGPNPPDGSAMTRLRITPRRWYQILSRSLQCRLSSSNDRWRLIQVLFSSTGGGGTPDSDPKRRDVPDYGTPDV